MVKGKRGWIKIVEATVAVLIVAGVLLIVIEKGYVNFDFNSEKIYEIQDSILKDIQLNDSLRQDIINITTLPINLESFPTDVRIKIESEIPSYLNCTAKICVLNQTCTMDEFIEGNVYSRSIAILAVNTEYRPRQIRIFCWEN